LKLVCASHARTNLTGFITLCITIFDAIYIYTHTHTLGLCKD